MRLAILAAVAALASSGVTHAQSVKFVSATAPKTTVEVGQTLALKISGTLANGKPATGRTYTCGSSNYDVATVTQTTCVVTGKAPGSVIITANMGGIAGKITLTVVAKPVTIAAKCGAVFNPAQVFPCADTNSADLPKGIVAIGFCVPGAQKFPCIDSLSISLSRGRVIGDTSRMPPPAPGDTTKMPPATSRMVSRSAAPAPLLLTDNWSSVRGAEAREYACIDSMKKAMHIETAYMVKPSESVWAKIGNALHLRSGPKVITRAQVDSIRSRCTVSR